MATNCRGKIVKIGLITFIRNVLTFQNGMEYRNSDV